MFELNSLVSLRAPLSVNLEVTDKCNLSCSFCFNAAPSYAEFMDSGEQPYMLEKTSITRQFARRERLIQILDKLEEAQVFEVRFFGGEFTVFKYWREIMSYAADKNFFISFVSNGYLFTEKDIDFLFECGIRECNLSVHGSEETHDKITNKKGSFKKVMNSIALLQKKNISVSVAYTPNADNLSNVYNFVELLNKQYSVKNFGINRLFQDERYKNLTHDDYLYLLSEIDRCHSDVVQ